MTTSLRLAEIFKRDAQQSQLHYRQYFPAQATLASLSLGVRETGIYAFYLRSNFEGL